MKPKKAFLHSAMRQIACWFCLGWMALSGQAQQLSAQDFAVIEGHFHDALGTFAELTLANALIEQNQLAQPLFGMKTVRDKMTAAIASLPADHAHRALFQNEIAQIEKAAPVGARELQTFARGKLIAVVHTARAYADAHAGDLQLQFADRAPLPVSVKTDKSNKVAVAEGQTPDFAQKWAARYFRVTSDELQQMLVDLGWNSLAEAKNNYLNMARLTAEILIRKLALTNYALNDFSRAEIGDLDAVKHLLRQLRHFKHGNDHSRVIIFDRTSGVVKWDSLLDGIDIESLTSERISLLPSRPRKGNPIASEFGLKIDGQTIVSFQLKHKRGKARGTAQQVEFSDITTRLRL